MTMPLETVRELEELAFAAWPALETVPAHGWLLRFADGYTKRANSVNALAPTAPVADILAVAQPRYAGRGLPLIFRLSPLAGPEADPALAALGFETLDETLVMTAPLAADARDDATVAIARHREAAWAAGFAAANQVPPEHQAIHDRMLAAIRPAAAFACLEVDGRSVTWGLAVAERGRVGLFDIVTAPEARRQGAARRLVMALLAWGQGQGARDAYLQVVTTNAPAIALYRSLGFVAAYRYHYRVENRIRQGAG